MSVTIEILDGCEKVQGKPVKTGDRVAASPDTARKLVSRGLAKYPSKAAPKTAPKTAEAKQK